MTCKGTAAVVHAMKACGGVEVLLHVCLTSVPDGGGVVSLTPRSLYPRGKRFRYPLNRGLCGPQSHSGRLGEVLICCSIWDWNPGSSR